MVLIRLLDLVLRNDRLVSVEAGFLGIFLTYFLKKPASSFYNSHVFLRFVDLCFLYKILLSVVFFNFLFETIHWTGIMYIKIRFEYTR